MCVQHQCIEKQFNIIVQSGSFAIKLKRSAIGLMVPTTGVPNAVVCRILSGIVHIKDPLLVS